MYYRSCYLKYYGSYECMLREPKRSSVVNAKVSYAGRSITSNIFPRNHATHPGLLAYWSYSHGGVKRRYVGGNFRRRRHRRPGRAEPCRAAVGMCNLHVVASVSASMWVFFVRRERALRLLRKIECTATLASSRHHSNTNVEKCHYNVNMFLYKPLEPIQIWFII